MDTFQHGTWNLPFGPYVLHVGVKTGAVTGKPTIVQVCMYVYTCMIRSRP